ncbi:rRNA maturation RNase YbeY [candidate division WOR-3 bacterium]|nr:rRNA maturation RNase YbeY [candidate division WOR-3 bacterium]
MSIKNPALSIVFVGKNEIRDYNSKYRKKRYVTDVISFPGSDRDYLGDMIICPEKVMENANLLRIRFEEELTRVIIHGFLHLLGFEDHTSQKKVKMWTVQEEILRKLKTENRLCSI